MLQFLDSVNDDNVRAHGIFPNEAEGMESGSEAPDYALAQEKLVTRTIEKEKERKIIVLYNLQIASF